MTPAPRPLRERRKWAPRDKQRGIALILVLWLSVLLTVIGASFAFGMHEEALSARNSVDSAQVRAAADGAIERTAYELSRPKVPDSWLPNGATHQYVDGDVTITVVATDEAAKIDINSAPDALITGLLVNVGGVDTETAAHLVDAIDDWKDADDLRRPNGAESAEYQAAGLKYKPSNAAFETVGEVSRVFGMTPAVFSRIAPSLTVYAKTRGINPATADRTVLLALPAATADTVDAFLAARAQAQASNLPIPPFPAAAGFSSAGNNVWRIRAVATLASGVTFGREAVVRQSLDPRRPLIILAWLQTASLPPPVPAATT